MSTKTDIPTADLAEAYKGSHFTVEGAGGDLQEWADGLTKMLEEENIGTPTGWSRTTGGDINAFAASRGEVTNPYSDDLPVLMFALDGLDIGRLAMFKIQRRARWFDDIIDNMVG